MVANTAARAVMTLGAAALLWLQAPAQQGGSIPVGGALDAAGRVSLDAALIIAVGVLWKALQVKDQRIAEKDLQVVAMATKVTETMALVMEAVKELRVTVSGMKISFDELPCSVRDRSSRPAGAIR